MTSGSHPGGTRRRPTGTASEPGPRRADKYHNHSEARRRESQESRADRSGIRTDTFRAQVSEAGKYVPPGKVFERLVRFGERVLRLQRTDAEDRAQEALVRYWTPFPREQRAVLRFTEQTVRLLVGFVWRVHSEVLRRERRHQEEPFPAVDNLGLTSSSDPFAELDTRRRFEALRAMLDALPPEVVVLLLQGAELVERPDAMSDRERQILARTRRKLARPAAHSVRTPRRLSRRLSRRRPTRR